MIFDHVGQDLQFFLVNCALQGDVGIARQPNDKLSHFERGDDFVLLELLPIRNRRQSPNVLNVGRIGAESNGELVVKTARIVVSVDDQFQVEMGETGIEQLGQLGARRIQRLVHESLKRFKFSEFFWMRFLDF